ncbi:MAG: HAD family phosphatase [Bacteroidales bacterium]|nr:HAD family phosphatase [Bacteroidales bacterium]MBN2817410.1 HAD family phosphatase [Bacteroidales bacterium]
MANNKTIKGVIFDFNGTLFWDSSYHEKAWREFALEVAGKPLSEEDMKNHIHGRINKDILSYVFQCELSETEVLQYSDKKEKLYRELIQSSDLNNLAQGSIELFEELKSRKISFTIATSSEISNVHFYFNYLKLDKWFNKALVVYDDGTMQPKPAPDIFLRAADKIDVPIEKCLVLEDSITGIKSAVKAGAGKILFVENDIPVNYKLVKDLVDGKISNLKEMLVWI